ncbi:hypothetical protein NGA_0384502 [Nannochloropsis gaditana CCMP526]|uniref:Anaphase-promoting complex, subunit CDC26 n=1 Tax=Nannochloropsis gaditana TaxID=72520 RepID=W7TS84_9STRA|nr:hypothetical protein NGA_0384502 [Nannochloropsis gaditana CCMP526]EKU22965.1 hypothetical protein NGA_0384502 [Nannochloropsis gaditana CCMP526]EWM23376.1 Anaphase-promoting complex, subunit CDC26 [Nannochloropsis gaditana]|eukprot:XP_005853394.1 hypothetical protein NGA_0384502 [Nannochloropsis gaditana CCMP526]
MLRRPPTRIELKPEDVEELEAIQERRRVERQHQLLHKAGTAGASAPLSNMADNNGGEPPGVRDVKTERPRTPTVAERIGLRK